jgi:hypothetical protein
MYIYLIINISKIIKTSFHLFLCSLMNIHINKNLKLFKIKIIHFTSQFTITFKGTLPKSMRFLK